MPNLELAAAFSDPIKAQALGEAIHGSMLVDDRVDIKGLPFKALVFGATDNLSLFTESADIGVYLVYRRIIKPRRKKISHSLASGVTAVFTMVANESMGHQRADQHWRDVHAPLAVTVHKAMSHYSQLSVIHRFEGPNWDGFALCEFDNLEDLNGKFFDTEEGKSAIAKDVARFADNKKSPRRIIAREVHFEKPKRV